MTSWMSGSVDISGGRLAYHRTGGGHPPLVLSHGLTDNGLCWRRLAKDLEADFDIIMLDARGHGDSSSYSADAGHDPGRDIAETIEAMALGSPIVMGHSLGARATAAFANAHPGRVAKVVLEDPAFVPLADPSVAEAQRARFRRQVERFRSMTEPEIIDLGKALSPSWSHEDFPDWAASKRQVDPEALPAYATPWQAQIDRIDAPTLVIHGESKRGSLISADVAAEAVAINANIHTIEIAGAGHNVRRANYPDFLDAVRAFLIGP